MANFTTRTQVINYLVGTGKPANYARAFTNEFYNFSGNTDTTDNIVLAGEQLPTSINAATAEQHYADWLGYGITTTPQGITFDGSLQYDLNGNYFSK
jgi:hypothetical protein